MIKWQTTKSVEGFPAVVAEFDALKTECETIFSLNGFWTPHRVLDLLERNPVKTCGALSDHCVTVKAKSDGDEWFAVEIPFWPQNAHVVKTVLRLVDKALKMGGNDTHVYTEKEGFRLALYAHGCDAA